MNYCDQNDNRDLKLPTDVDEQISLEVGPELSKSGIAKQYTVKLSALRFYETDDRLHLRQELQSDSIKGSDCHRIKMILRARQQGFSIADIRERVKASESAATSRDLVPKVIIEKALSNIHSLEQRLSNLDQAIHDLREKYEKLHQLEGDVVRAIAFERKQI